jgi:aminocarboxymuconate-semialdehyde decarboxylase
LQEGWRVFPTLGEQMSMSPAEQARRLYFDTLVFDDAMLKFLVASFGSQALMIGTDYPFNFSERAPLDRLVAAGLDADTTVALVQLNAERFLGLAGGRVT